MNNNKYKGIITVIYSVAIILLFIFLIVEPVIFGSTGLNGYNKYMLSIVSVQLGLITAWIYNNNHKPKN